MRRVGRQHKNTSQFQLRVCSFSFQIEFWPARQKTNKRGSCRRHIITRGIYYLCIDKRMDLDINLYLNTAACGVIPNKRQKMDDKKFNLSCRKKIVIGSDS